MYVALLRLVPLETLITFLLAVGKVPLQTWLDAKTHVLSVEDEDGDGKLDGNTKFILAYDLLVKRFPKLDPGWARVLIQLAWLFYERTGWAKK